MNNPIKATHREIQIEYDERENKWVFELRGRERKAESLAKAKEFIDRPEPIEKTAFTKTPAWFREYSTDWQEVQVTSIAEPPSYVSGQFVWISYSKSKRQRVRASEVFARSTKNDELVAKWRGLQNQIDELSKVKHSIQLDPIKLPDDPI